MPIRILTDEVASQIAAGEVVERPASVVKELIENALDASASQITIRISEAGRRLVEVADDGIGIPEEEITLALARHATSKLANAEDLFHIRTLGFRGEALASIASVSHFTLISRTENTQTGARLRVEGGRIGAVDRVGAPTGTVAMVEDLFYNVPARLKFLKRDSTERQQIDGLVTRYALAYPDVRFHLYHDGKLVFQTGGHGNRREVLAGLYGIETARQMLEVSFEEEYLRVNGFISPVALTRSNRKEITFFVNGRWVQDTALAAALLNAYHTLLMVGRYPVAALFISLDPEEVDVNVHPAKVEVRFRSQDRVFSGVQRAVRRALLAYSPIPPVSPGAWRPAVSSGIVDPTWEFARNVSGQRPLTWESVNAAAPEGESLSTVPTVVDAEKQVEVTVRAGDGAINGKTPPEGLLPGMLPLLRLVGQVGLAYLIAEGPDGLYLIDQHAAHERVLFERFLKQHGSKMPAQVLLEPTTVHLPPASAQLLQSQLDVLGSLGFQIEPFGPNTFRVRAIPTLLVGADPQTAVRAVVEDFEEDETPLQSEVETRLIARICKRSAVKAGQPLSTDEQRALLAELETCRSPRTCPHGRPTMIHLSVDLLERQFGRRGGR